MTAPAKLIKATCLAVILFIFTPYMDLRTHILADNSKAYMQQLATTVAGDKKYYTELVQLLLRSGEYRVVQRAAWIVGMIADLQPRLVLPYLPQMVNRMLETGLPPAVRRNLVRILQFVPIPESLHGTVMNACFDFLADPKEHIAVRCFSMTVLANLAAQYPELQQELLTIIEDSLEQGASAGFRSRAKHTVQQLRRQQQG